MVSQNLNIPHRFICVTEDNEGIESGIDIIDLPKEPELKYWWNKLFLFKKGFLPEGRYLFFDLDVIIQDNIEEIANYKNEKVCFVEKVWVPNQIKECRNNSSLMLWETGMVEHIWDYFEMDINKFVKVHEGIDTYIYFQGIPYETFDGDWFYSYVCGDRFDNVYNEIRRYKNTLEKYREGYKVCLFNQVKRFEKLKYGTPYDREMFKKYIGNYV